MSDPDDHHTILESLADHAVVILSLDGRVTYWSAGAERMLGHQRSDMLGRTLCAIYTEDDRRQGSPLRELDLALQTGHAAENRLHVRKYGTLLAVSGDIRPISQPGGPATGFIKVFRAVAGNQP